MFSFLVSRFSRWSQQKALHHSLWLTPILTLLVEYGRVNTKATSDVTLVFCCGATLCLTLSVWSPLCVSVLHFWRRHAKSYNVATSFTLSPLDCLLGGAKRSKVNYEFRSTCFPILLVPLIPKIYGWALGTHASCGGAIFSLKRAWNKKEIAIIWHMILFWP